MFEKLTDAGFDILALHHAQAILKHDMPQAVKLLERVLLDIEIPIAELAAGGGGEGKGTQSPQGTGRGGMVQNTDSK